MNKKDYEAKTLSAAFTHADPHGSLSIPVYNTLAYEFETAADMEAAFCGHTADHVYSRITNPTVQYFEDRVKTITDAFSVTALNSGMAAISNALLTLAYNGCNIVTSKHLFGNTYSFFANTLKPFGVEIRFCDITNPREVRAAIDENTCAVFLEIISNPQMEVADLSALSAVAHEKGVPLVADTTLIPFSVFRAGDFGVDIEIVASTKYVSCGGAGLGGLIVDYGAFDWSGSPKLNEFARKFGKEAFTAKLRKEIHRNLGAYMTPQVAYLQALGLETLNVRYERQSRTCKELAERLAELPQIASVNYTGLPQNEYYELSVRQFGECPGAMLTFDLSSKEACYTVINRVKLIRRATNLFDNKSLIIHPASTIFGTFTPEQRAEMNVRDTTIRLSVGLESTDALFEDIRQAL